MSGESVLASRQPTSAGGFQLVIRGRRSAEFDHTKRRNARIVTDMEANDTCLCTRTMLNNMCVLLGVNKHRCVSYDKLRTLFGNGPLCGINSGGKNAY